MNDFNEFWPGPRAALGLGGPLGEREGVIVIPDSPSPPRRAPSPLTIPSSPRPPPALRLAPPSPFFGRKADAFDPPGPDVSHRPGFELPVPKKAARPLGVLDGPELIALTADGFKHMAPDFLLKPLEDQPWPNPGEQDGKMAQCEEAVRACFPDICPNFLRDQGLRHLWDSHAVVSGILDDIEQGKQYPKRESRRKRKRDDEKEAENVEEGSDEAARKRLAAMDPRLASKDRTYVKRYIQTAKSLLKDEFPQLYVADVESVLKQHDYKIYPAYLELDKATWDPTAAPARVKKGRAGGRRSSHAAEAARVSPTESDKDAVAAFEVARKECRAKADARHAKEREKKLAEEAEKANFERAKAEGTVAECGCCFDEMALNRMVHCDASGAVHWFCLECAKRMAEHVIGSSQYLLRCMATDGCDATFARDQRELFLDGKMAKALDKIEQEAVIRMAGIENLVQCPFCDYAAEYPPVEENKEFRCEDPGCGIVSCRLVIEEAMSAALIRKCNKCGTPFIKENGCNKMRCTRSGCKNTQCYVCSESCDYSHFDDPSRGGKPGNCPLFDNVEDRHRDEVRRAEEEARKKVIESNPLVDVEMLKIQFSDKVKEGEERRKGPPNAPPPPPLRRGGPMEAADGMAHGVGLAGNVVIPPPPAPQPAPPAHQHQWLGHILPDQRDLYRPRLQPPVYPPIDKFGLGFFGFDGYPPRAARAGQPPQGPDPASPNAQRPRAQPPQQQPPQAFGAEMLVPAQPLDAPQPQAPGQPLDLRRQFQPVPSLLPAIAAVQPAPAVHPSWNIAAVLPSVPRPAENAPFAMYGFPNDPKIPPPEEENMAAPAQAETPPILTHPAQASPAQQSPFARLRPPLAATVVSGPEPAQPAQPAAAAPAPAVPSAFYHHFPIFPGQPPIPAAAGRAPQPNGHVRQALGWTRHPGQLHHLHE
ncbi:hypothetical protein VTJ83DRAFT_4559 [Remersonia thermophila]|uniref:RING-type domain-containing protein n=1 Tax=Remersonia thermophila TaxID=72144 RepID=A0ABR4DAI4_9PEZI